MRDEFWEQLTEPEKTILLTFNLEHFKAMWSWRWKPRGWVDGNPPSDEVCCVLMRGLVIEMPQAPAGKKAVARKWLCDNGYGGW